MTWDPLGLETLGDDWVAAPEVVVSEQKDRSKKLFYPVRQESIMKCTFDIC